MKGFIQLKKVAPVFFAGLVCFGLLPATQGVSPAPDGGYPGGNTAEGQNALLSLTTGGFNTAIGFLSLRSNTTGSLNTAIGAGTLLANTADQNTATGAGALLSNIGTSNTANGVFALFSNTTGSINTAIGANALYFNTTGTNSIALGFDAGTNVTTADHVICIGSAGANAANSCFIGNIRNVQTVNGDALPVVIDSTGQLGTASSSRRFKDGIKGMDKASEAILALKPVTFHYKNDKRNTSQFGLIAEEVAKVNEALVVRDNNGEIYTVRYDAVNAMLLNEFLKEHRKMQELESTVGKQEASAARQEATIAVQQKQIEALTAGLEKVSAQFEVSKPAPQTVLTDR
jgi:hypothetical protein